MDADDGDPSRRERVDTEGGQADHSSRPELGLRHGRQTGRVLGSTDTSLVRGSAARVTTMRISAATEARGPNTSERANDSQNADNDGPVRSVTAEDFELIPVRA
jgi:hypothetical protein